MLRPRVPRRSPAPRSCPKKSTVVNPHQFVGHFLLPSGTRVVIKPKIDTSNIFRILAYIYAREHPDPFREAEVSYRPDQLLFEPLVELFNRHVAKRVRRGLYQNYQEHEENLLVFRGRLVGPQHIRLNLARPDNVFCRFTQNTHDVDDNQIIKWTLRFLLTVYPWSAPTVQALRANFHQFEAVALKQVSRTAFANRHYHRLNEDYRLLHDFCRLFLEKASIRTIRTGTISGVLARHESVVRAVCFERFPGSWKGHSTTGRLAIIGIPISISGSHSTGYHRPNGPTRRINS